MEIILIMAPSEQYLDCAIISATCELQNITNVYLMVCRLFSVQGLESWLKLTKRRKTITKLVFAFRDCDNSEHPYLQVEGPLLIPEPLTSTPVLGLNLSTGFG